MRSEDPGDCPADIPEVWNTALQFTGRACGSDTINNRGSVDGWCSYEGTTIVTATRTGLTGKATHTFTPCDTAEPACVANFDLTYDLKDGGT